MTNDRIPPNFRGGSATESSNVGIKSGDNVTDLPAVSASLPGNGGGDMPCDVCRSTGLAILPLRYAVVPASCPGAGLGPFSRGRACKEDLSAAGYEYAVRTLRQGMLYVFYEQSGPYGPRQWEAYAVAENGTLWRQPSAHAARRIVGGGLPACTRSAHNPMRMEFITIQKPALCGTVWIAFAQDVWTPATLDRYATDAKLRAERMQPIQPAQWIGAPQAKGDTAPVVNADSLKAVMEYRSFAGVVGEPAELPHLSKPRPISREDGSYDSSVLTSNATRYPWALRNQTLQGGKEDEQCQTRYALLCQSSHNGGPLVQRQQYAPMMLALWDAVGVVHELNGYRHDIIGNMARYKDERAIELDAAGHIDEISTLLQNNAAILADRYAQASRDRLREIEEANRGTSNPMAQAGMDAMKAQGVDSNNDAYWDGLSKALLPSYQRQAKEHWEKKYWPLIDETKYRNFKENAQAFSETALRLLESRSEALGKWLGNELFLATLEDYDGTSPQCGVRFEDVVTNAIEGLGVDASGRQLLGQLAGNLDVTSRACLLWRVMAQNQTDARKELQQALGQADGQKNVVLESLGAGWSAFATGTGYLKKFLGYYKSFESVQKEAAPSTATSRMLRETGVDRFVTTAGAFMLNRFPLNGVQDTVGNGIVRFVFYTRALMDPVEASDLISREASTGVGVRQYFLERVKHYRAQKLTEGTPMMYALRDVERHQGRALMQERWKSASESSRNAVRLSSLTGVLELINFINLLSKADKQAKDYGSLVASGMSLVSVYTSVASTVSKDFFGEASRSVGRMKAVGGWLGGFGTYIGIYYNAGDIVYNLRRDRYGVAFLSVLTFFAGAFTGGGQFLTAFAYSAPVLQKALGRRGIVIFLDGLRAGIQAAAAKEGEQILASVTMKRIGLWVVRLGGWEVTLAVTAIQGMIWAISPNALEVWCERNYFGKVTKGGLFGFGASDPHYPTVKEQNEAFLTAMGEVTVRPSP